MVARYGDRRSQLCVIWTQTLQEARQRKRMVLTHTQTHTQSEQERKRDAGCQHVVISWLLTKHTVSDEVLEVLLLLSTLSSTPDSDLCQHAIFFFRRVTAINSPAQHTGVDYTHCTCGVFSFSCEGKLCECRTQLVDKTTRSCL